MSGLALASALYGDIGHPVVFDSVMKEGQSLHTITGVRGRAGGGTWVVACWVETASFEEISCEVIEVGERGSVVARYGLEWLWSPFPSPVSLDNCRDQRAVLGSAGGGELGVVGVEADGDETSLAAFHPPPVTFPAGFVCLENAIVMYGTGEREPFVVHHPDEDSGHQEVTWFSELAGCTIRDASAIGDDELGLISECGPSANGEPFGKGEIKMARWAPGKSTVEMIATFDGRLADLGVADDRRSAAVVFDASGDMTWQRIEVRCIDLRKGSNIDCEGEILTTEVDLAPERFDVASLSKDRWAVAGAKGGHPWLGVVDQNGVLVDEYWGQDEQVSANYRVATSDQAVYLTSSIVEFFDCGERQCSRQGIRIFQFELAE